MTKRKQLQNNILASSRQLDAHRSVFQISCADAKSRLQAPPPAVLIAGGVIAGVIVQRVGWRPTYGFALMGYRMFSSLSVE